MYTVRVRGSREFVGLKDYDVVSHKVDEAGALHLFMGGDLVGEFSISSGLGESVHPCKPAVGDEILNPSSWLSVRVIGKAAAK